MNVSQFWLRVLVLCAIGLGITGCLKDEAEAPMDPCVVGDTRSADDDCNTCVCTDDGAWECTEEACLPPECTEDECGPRPAIPDRQCSDGSTAGIGSCVRNADATCGWSRTECPPECEPGDELSQFDGNDCVCNGAGEFECLCEGSSPDPSCICNGGGEWVCENPNFCSDDQPCTAQYHSCNCEWVCSADALPPMGGCDVECGDTGAPPECACEDGNCRVDDPACNDRECEVYVDTCSCQWACDDGSDLRPACERECPPEELGPMPSCGCENDRCELETAPPNQCDEGLSCEPFYDTCICDWNCTSDIQSEPICDQLCAQEDSGPPPLCECDGSECLSPTQCTDGDTQDAGDGCNTCVCDGGQWACTLIACNDMCDDGTGCEAFYDNCSCSWGCISSVENPVTCARECPPDATPAPICECRDNQCVQPAECADGETRDAGDGCNTCTCRDGRWACTLIGCVEPCEEGDTRMDDCNTCFCDGGQWACTERACPEACQPDDCPGPRPQAPTRTCWDGTTAGPECQRNAIEECAWVVTMCPPEPPPWQACDDDTDCMTTGCNGTMCASQPQNSTCQASPSDACYQDSNITTCGCDRGVCSWSNREALEMCVEDAGRNGLPEPAGRPN